MEIGRRTEADIGNYIYITAKTSASPHLLEGIFFP